MEQDSREKNEKEIQYLYTEAENLYNLALDNVENMNDEESAYWGLGGLYRSWSYFIQQKDIKIHLLKTAIYYYMCSYDCGNEHGLKRAKKIAADNKIVVNFNDIDGWAVKEKIIG